MDDPPTNSPRRPSPASLSRTPSWFLLGFLLGAGFVWLNLTREASRVVDAAPSPRPGAQAATVKAPEAKSAPPKPRQLSEIEAVFEVWGRYAVWDDNRTEVALWNRQTNSFADFYEILRDASGQLYFRSIPRLTRPLLAHGTKPEAPLIFTESIEMRKEWLETRSQLVPATPLPAVPNDLSRPEAPTTSIDISPKPSRP